MFKETSVVTIDRFASGLTYDEYIAQIKVNKDKFEQFYKQCTVSAEDTEFFKSAAGRPGGPAKLLVIGEDWCPDVYRGMPTMARIAEAANIAMRIFPRDQNMDIMNEFLKHGQFNSIPVAVFYTSDHKYLCHWIERPNIADKERAEIQKQTEREMNTVSAEELRSLIREKTQARQSDWQQESIKEMRLLISGALTGI